jgi:tRNA nucleotidyltransferase (CCA-adding enzyme)
MRILLVGGAVRDMLLGRAAENRDFLVLDATREEFLRRFPEAREVGKSFPVFLVGRDEYAFPRGAHLTEDLAARDLTVNALALDESGGLFCHPRALEDLRNRVLRPASERSLPDDPLRVFRAARFLACLPGFSAHPELIETMQGVARAGLLAGVSAERVGQETQKALAGPRPGLFVTLLAEAGCLDPWFSDLAQAPLTPAGPAPHHAGDLLAHTIAVMDRLAGDALAVWMGLCHDLGKTTTDPALWPKHHGHEQAGGALAASLAERLRLSNRFRQAGEAAAALHMIAGRYPELKPGTRVDLLVRLAAKRLVGRMFRLALADTGEDFSAEARADLSAVESVHLPPEERGLGAASGEKLRQLRAQAVAERRRGVLTTPRQ